jgi:hypothetical protein
VLTDLARSTAFQAVFSGFDSRHGYWPKSLLKGRLLTKKKAIVKPSSATPAAPERDPYVAYDLTSAEAELWERTYCNHLSHIACFHICMAEEAAMIADYLVLAMRKRKIPTLSSLKK